MSFWCSWSATSPARHSHADSGAHPQFLGWPGDGVCRRHLSHRAYGKWQFFGRYRNALLQSAVELIQLFPPGASAKNGADIKLCVDATEDISRFAHIGTVIIIGGDSDLMPVAQKIKAAGRKGESDHLLRLR